MSEFFNDLQSTDYFDGNPIRVTRDSGPDHMPRFLATCTISGKTFSSYGSSKKEAKHACVNAIRSSWSVSGARDHNVHHQSPDTRPLDAIYPLLYRLNQEELNAIANFISYRLMTIEKNPGPKAAPFSKTSSLETKNIDFRRMNVKQNVDGKLQHLAKISLRKRVADDSLRRYSVAREVGLLDNFSELDRQVIFKFLVGISQQYYGREYLKVLIDKERPLPDFQFCNKCVLQFGTDLTMSCDNCAGYADVLKQNHNKLMHALNGNGPKNKGPKPKQKEKPVSVSKPMPSVSKIAKTVEQRMARDVSVHNFAPLSRVSSQGAVPPKLRNAMFIAESISNPATITKELRWNDQFDEVPTASVVPKAQYPVDFVSSGGYLPTTDTCAVLFKNPQCSMIKYTAKPNGAAGYGYVFQCKTAGVANTTYSGTTFQIATPAGEKSYINVATARPVVNNPWSPHGNTLFAGTASGNQGDMQRYIWFDELSTLNCRATFPNALAAGNVLGIFTLDRLADTGVFQDVYRGDLTCTGANAAEMNLTGIAAGYYSIAYTRSASFTPGALSFNGGTSSYTVPAGITMYNTGSYSFAHLPIASWASNYSSITDYRTLAASIMYSNTSAPLQRQGKVVAYQGKGSENWFQFASGGNNNYSNLVQVTDEVNSKTLDTGLYTWMAPNSINEFDMDSFYDTFNGDVIDSYFPLMGRNFIMVYAICTNANGLDGVWTTHHCIEYASNNQWVPTGYSNVSSNDIEMALEIIRKVPRVLENPSHQTTIWQKIKYAITHPKEVIADMAKMAIDYGPTVIKVAKFVAGLV